MQPAFCSHYHGDPSLALDTQLVGRTSRPVLCWCHRYITQVLKRLQRNAASEAPEKYQLMHFTRKSQGSPVPIMNTLRIHLNSYLQLGPHVNLTAAKAAPHMSSIPQLTKSTWGTMFASQADLCCYYPSNALIWMASTVVHRGQTSQSKPTDLSKVLQDHYGRIQDDKCPSAGTCGERGTLGPPARNFGDQSRSQSIELCGQPGCR
jgi:hypothetical protein